MLLNLTVAKGSGVSRLSLPAKGKNCIWSKTRLFYKVLPSGWFFEVSLPAACGNYPNSFLSLLTSEKCFFVLRWMLAALSLVTSFMASMKSSYKTFLASSTLEVMARGDRDVFISEV